MKNKNRKIGIEFYVMVITILALAFFVYLEVSYYNRSVRDAGEEESMLTRTYSRYYEMIVDNRNSSFWDEVYQNAKEEAARNDVLLSMMQVDWMTEYSKDDYIDMCIANKVDGIILEYNGESGLSEKIDEAEKSGIPVVTIINDASRSSRQAFVGINDYQLGAAYASQVSRLVNETTRKILILSNREEELEKNQFYSRIYAAAQEAQSDSRIQVREQRLVSKSPFDVEEAIRNIFQSQEGPPQILICLDEVTTECACQAMIDFNMVGDVSIIGYSFSDTILDAVNKGLIPVTICMNSSEIGAFSVDALQEYAETGRSNTYYTVNLDVVGMN